MSIHVERRKVGARTDYEVQFPALENGPSFEGFLAHWVQDAPLHENPWVNAWLRWRNVFWFIVVTTVTNAIMAHDGYSGTSIVIAVITSSLCAFALLEKKPVVTEECSDHKKDKMFSSGKLPPHRKGWLGYYSEGGLSKEGYDRFIRIMNDLGAEVTHNEVACTLKFSDHSEYPITIMSYEFGRDYIFKERFHEQFNGVLKNLKTPTGELSDEKVIRDACRDLLGEKHGNAHTVAVDRWAADRKVKPEEIDAKKYEIDLLDSCRTIAKGSNNLQRK